MEVNWDSIHLRVPSSQLVRRLSKLLKSLENTSLPSMANDAAVDAKTTGMSCEKNIQIIKNQLIFQHNLYVNRKTNSFVSLRSH